MYTGTRTSTLVFIVCATLTPAFVHGYRVLARTRQAAAGGLACLQPSPDDLPEDSRCADFRYTKTCFFDDFFCWPVSEEDVDEIVNNALNTRDSSQKKHAMILAGGMGSGKSTAARYVASQMGVHLEEFVASGYDDVARALPQYKSYMQNQDKFAPLPNGMAQAGKKWDHMIGLMGSCRDVIRPAVKRIATEASKRGLNLQAEGFDSVAKILSVAEACYDITLVTVTNDVEEAVCRALQRQDEDHLFKDIPGVRSTYDPIKDDFSKTRSMLLQLFSKEGFYNSRADRHVKMCPGARFHLWNCDNTGESIACKRGGSDPLNDDWAQVWRAWVEIAEPASHNRTETSPNSSASNPQGWCATITEWFWTGLEYTGLVSG